MATSAVNDADIIVIGGGGSGLAAASEAAALGREVILLEKNPSTGGTTSWSVGSVTITQSPHQRRHGIQDSPDEHFEDMAKHAGALAPRDNLALRRVLVDHTTEMLEWLERLGVVFVGPMPEPPHRVNRMHNVVPNSRSFAYHLTRYCQELGVEIRTNARATRLLVERGRVTGVEATVNGVTETYRARQAVILATGDYSGDRELKARFATPEVVDVEPVNVASTGDGHKLALELGARVVNGDLVRGPIMRFVPPAQTNLIGRLPPWRPIALGIAWAWEHLPRRMLRPFLMSFLTTALGPSNELFKAGAILVNREGQRFTDERGQPSNQVPTQTDRLAYIVFDARIARQFTRWP
ncbi:MAG: FAD-dependent oxidoreductase, partial [Chloroflexota bacterium]